MWPAVNFDSLSLSLICTMTCFQLKLSLLLQQLCVSLIFTSLSKEIKHLEAPSQDPNHLQQ